MEKNKKIVKDSKLVYRTGEVFDRKKTVNYVDLVDDWKLDKEKNQVVKVGTTSTLEIVNSHKSSILSNIFSRFLDLEGDVLTDEVLVPVNKNKLESMLEFADNAEEIKKKYNLDESLSISDTFKVVGELLKNNEAKIKKMIESSKEVAKDETKKEIIEEK